VWARLAGAPWWVYSLFTGVPFGVLQCAPAFGGHSWSLGVIEGAVFGLAMGPLLALMSRRARTAMAEQVCDGQDEVAGPHVTEQLRTATRAVNRAMLRGEVPAEPASRRRAYRLAEYHVTTMRRMRPFVLPILVLITVGGFWFARTDQSGWWGGLTGLFVLIYNLACEAGLRRAVRLLRLPGPDGQAGGE